jgi:acyl-CoA dehydrogenase
MAAGCVGFSQVCVDDAISWARERKVFGGRLIDSQVIRHKLVDMQQRVNVTRAYLESLAWRIEQGESPVADICMLKNQATQTMAFCASEAVQIHGGMGFMRGTRVERIYREVKVNAIGGGAEEIMKDLAARQMGW